MAIIRHALMMTALLSATAMNGCALWPGERNTGYVHRFMLPPGDAARCFARNAEAHSSALMSGVSAGARGRFDVVVRVRNGATYAVARIDPASVGATGVIDLYVQSSQGNRQLLDRLLEGC